MEKPKNEEIDFGKEEKESEDKGFSIEDFLMNNKIAVTFFLLGLFFVGFGIFLFKRGYLSSGDKVDVILDVSETPSLQVIFVEISGAVETPGVYKLNQGSRVEDLLIVAGGISANADRTWVEKYINRAAKLTDGQKLYILREGEQSGIGTAKNSDGIKVDQGVLGVGVETLVNINTASLSQLDSLPGIGQVYGKSIIDHRPYSTVEELVGKGAIKQGVYEKIKDLVTVY